MHSSYLLSSMTMNPAYGDGKTMQLCLYVCISLVISPSCVCGVARLSFTFPDVWAGGFSSDEEGDSVSDPDNHYLDLLASLVEETEGEGGGRRGEGDNNDAQKKALTFQESLTTPDKVSLMKGKLHMYDLV